MKKIVVISLFCFLVVISAIVTVFVFKAKTIDKPLYFLPTQSYKATTSFTEYFSIPIVTENSTLEDFKPIALETINGESINVVDFTVNKRDSVNTNLNFFVVDLQFFIDQNNSKEIYKFNKVKYSYLNEIHTGEVNACYEIEQNKELPILIGAFQVRDNENDMIFEVMSNSDKDILISDVDVGSEVKVIKRKVFGLNGKETDVEGDLVLKPGEIIKQRIIFDRNIDAFAQLSLRITYNDGESKKWRNILGFELDSMMDENKIRAYIEQMKK